MTQRGCAYVLAAVAVILWAFFFVIVAEHYRTMARAGYSGTWDFWVYLPLATLMALVCCVAFFIRRKMSAGTLLACSVTALVALLPLLMLLGGGV